MFRIYVSKITSKASLCFMLAFMLFYPVMAQLENPVKILNSPYDEQNPVFSPTGELFFSVGFHPDNQGGSTDYGDIWMSSMNEEGEWKLPERVPDLSTEGNDVLVGFSDALTALVYHSGGNGKKQGIHQYSRFGKSWNYLRSIDMGNFKNNSMHFSGRLSADGKIMVMAMNSFGTYGNEDIYVSFKQSDHLWTSPFNLGPQVNSFAQEQTPYLADDMVTLYFSSNVHGSRRGKDIYMAKRKGNSWEEWSMPEPVSILNSRGSEQNFITFKPEPELVMLTSTQNSEGFGDFILVRAEELSKVSTQMAENVSEEFFEEKEDVATIELDQETSLESPSDAAKDEPLQVVEERPTFRPIQIVDAGTMQPLEYFLEVGDNLGVTKPMANQMVLLEAFEAPNWQTVQIMARGYIPVFLEKEEWLDLSGEMLMMQPAIPGAAIILDNIQFNRGTSDFADAKSIQVLDKLVAFMKENETIKIRLEGHTDNAGDPGLNKDLSLKRASKIRGYMTINGIDFERIRISGWGGTRPIADNSTEEGRERNRRVQLLIEK